MELKQKKGRLVVKLLLIIAAAFVALNVIQVAVISQYTKSKMANVAETNYQMLTNEFSDSITSTIEKYYAELATYTKNHIVRTKDPKKIVAWLRENSDIRPDDFDYVAFVDKEGNFDSDINTHTVIKDRDYFQAIMIDKKNFYVDDPVSSKTSGKTVLHICRPVDVDGERIGFFTAVILVEHIQHIVEGKTIGKTGVATIYSSKNDPIGTSGDMETIKKSMTRPGEAQRFASNVGNLGGKQGIFYLTFAEGKKMFIYSPVKNTKWYITTAIDHAEVIEASDATSKLIITFSIITAVVLIIIIALAITSSIKPLIVVETAINEIATGNADLTKRIQLKGANNNEIGRVVDGFNQFTAKLQEIVKELKYSKQELTTTGGDLTASTQDTASSIEQIIANINAMGSNINQQSDSVHQTAGAVNEIASNIESLNRMIEAQTSSVTQASAAVEEMIGNINSVNSSVGKMAESFEMLERKAQDGVQKQEDVNARIAIIASESEALQEANSVISSIAEQTNLLAMNAAIEAAHAGEAGKGFSVVADEIRKLSETSSEQSNTIGERLQKITEGIEEIVRESKNASESFAAVSNGMGETSNLVMEIKNAMEEQEEGSKQISVALHNMNDSSLQVKNASEEMSEGNKAILTEIKSLQEATFSMKSGMEEMSVGATKINETGAALSGISDQMGAAINKIGEQVDLFKV